MANELFKRDSLAAAVISAFRSGACAGGIFVGAGFAMAPHEPVGITTGALAALRVFAAVLMLVLLLGLTGIPEDALGHRPRFGTNIEAQAWYRRFRVGRIAFALFLGAGLMIAGWRIGDVDLRVVKILVLTGAMLPIAEYGLTRRWAADPPR